MTVEDSSAVFEATVEDGVCRLARPGTRWLSTGFDGGERLADAAYNVTVEEPFDRTDLAAYAAERRAAAGFKPPGPTLLTGVSQRHARRARLGPIEAVATAGLSNPASLPVPGAEDDFDSNDSDDSAGRPRTGTVNLVVGTGRSLAPGGLETLLAVAVEAKATTLLGRTGFPGTTSDAAVVACDPSGERAAFAGSATEVGRAARVCVRDALLAALDSRYADGEIPESVAAADHGVVADGRARVSTLE